MTNKDIEKLIDSKSSVKVDLGCGAHKQGYDWIGIDIRETEASDIVHNLEDFPWPLPDECASLVLASHLVEHIEPHGGVFMDFMDEAWRILKPGGEFMIIVPYAGSPGYWQDPTHCNPCNEATWYYFDPLHPSNYYKIYKPKPWKIKENVWHSTGNLEVVLIKRRTDESYYE